MEEKAIICADVIASYGGKIVLVQRLTNPVGLALVGGKLDPGELLSQTAKREFFEETGLDLAISGVLSTFAGGNRDPRGHYVSTVFVGKASGNPKSESQKTKVILVKTEELPSIKDQFILDHWEILETYLEYQNRTEARKMANKVKPIKPGEVADKKKIDIPDAAFEAFNELIAENYNGRTATVYQDKVVERMAAKGLNRNEIFKKGWLDVEEIYGKTGWKVEYDKPGYNEDYAAHFIFTNRRHRD